MTESTTPTRLQLPSERLKSLYTLNRAKGCDSVAAVWASLLAYLDEQATVHPIAGGQDADWEARLLDQYHQLPEDKPLTTMPRDYGQGFAHCGHGYAPGSPNCPHCHPTPENITYLVNSNRSLRDELAEAQAELTRIKEEAASWEKACSVAMAHNDRLAAESERALADANEELTRIKADNERLSGELEYAHQKNGNAAEMILDLQGKLAELKTDLAWEKGWDLCRKAQMGAVVEAARKVASELNIDDQTTGAEHALYRALSALDRTDPSPILLTREVSGDSGSGSDNGA